MEKGTKIEIISVSRGQQFDIDRPVNIGAKGVLIEEHRDGCWYVSIIDPKDGCPCRIWFHDFDFKIIE